MISCTISYHDSATFKFQVTMTVAAHWQWPVTVCNLSFKFLTQHSVSPGPTGPAASKNHHWHILNTEAWMSELPDIPATVTGGGEQFNP